MLCIRTGSNRLNIHTDRYCLCQLVHMWTDRQQTAELQNCRLLHPLRAQHCPHGKKHLQSAVMETNISSLPSWKQTSPVCRHRNKHLQSAVTETNICRLSSWNQTSPDCRHGNKHPPTVAMETKHLRLSLWKQTSAESYFVTSTSSKTHIWKTGNSCVNKTTITNGRIEAIT